jgi:hypothetical protein
LAELKSEKEASDTKRRMLEAGTAAPGDSVALTDRLRDRAFWPVNRLPVGLGPRPAFQTRLVDEILRLPACAALERAMLDQGPQRDKARVCRPHTNQISDSKPAWPKSG